MTSPAWRIVPAEPVAMRFWYDGWNYADWSDKNSDEPLYAADARPDYDALAVELCKRLPHTHRHNDMVPMPVAIAAALRGYFEGE